MASSQPSEGIEEEEEENQQLEEQLWNLDTIPKELFLHICTFLSMKFITDVLSQVCTRFKCLIEDDVTWRIRLFTRWPSRYPIIKSEDFCWKDACREREEQYRLWRDGGVNMKKYHIAQAHFAAVDVVHLIENGRLCLSGSRDHSIKMWNLERLNEQPADSDIDMDIFSAEPQKDSAHAGWIWSMTYSDFHKDLYSGAWDSKIKSWDLTDFTLKETYFVKSPVLCLAFSENVLVSGCYDRKVSFFDPRAGTDPIFKDSLHKQPVLCIAADDKFVISGSEDRSLVVYNRVAGKVWSEMQLYGYPMSICYSNNHLWIGDNRGRLHVIDPLGEKFELVKSYMSGHRSQVSGVHYSSGSLISSSLDKSLRVAEPCDNLKLISEFSFKSGVAGISAYKDILACANSDDSVTIWMPNDLVSFRPSE